MNGPQGSICKGLDSDGLLRIAIDLSEVRTPSVGVAQRELWHSTWVSGSRVSGSRVSLWVSESLFGSLGLGSLGLGSLDLWISGFLSLSLWVSLWVSGSLSGFRVSGSPTPYRYFGTGVSVHCNTYFNHDRLLSPEAKNQETAFSQTRTSKTLTKSAFSSLYIMYLGYLVTIV